MNTQKKQFRIGLIAVVIISLHVILSLYLLFVPRAGNRLLAIYKQLALVGPFFTESRIKSTHYLAIRSMKDNAWSPFRRPSREYFSEYNNLPWRLNKLAYILYEIHLASALRNSDGERSAEKIKKSAAFHELHGILMKEFVEGPVDSIQIISGLEHYNPETHSVLSDTAFSFKYQPSSIGNAEK